MGTSADRPYLDVIYKLCETQTFDGAFTPIMKLSKDKSTLPGRKQVYRFKGREGSFRKDVIALVDERMDGEPLLVKVMEKGKLTYSLPTLPQIQAVAAENLSKLPEEYKVLTGAIVYPVELSRKLQNLIKTLKRQLTINEINGGASNKH
jgi:nicotinate phosphoribosyltransferase